MSEANRKSTEGPATGAMLPRPPTLTAPEPTEYGMSPHQPNATPAATRPRRERTLIAVCAATTVAAVLGIVLLLTGDDKPTATVPAPTAPGTIEPAASSPAAATPEDLAAEEAKARYLEYVKVSDRVAQGGYDNPKLYETVAVDPERTQLFLTARRLADFRTTGETQVDSLSVRAVDLDPRGTYPAVRLLVCLDVSQVSVFDAKGPAVAPERLDRIKSEAVLHRVPPGAFPDDPARTGWYVAEVIQRGEPC